MTLLLLLVPPNTIGVTPGSFFQPGSPSIQGAPVLPDPPADPPAPPIPPTPGPADPPVEYEWSHDPEDPAIQPQIYIYSSTSAGTPRTLEPLADFEDIVWNVSDAGQINFNHPTKDASPTRLKQLAREVQVWRDSGDGARCLGTGIIKTTNSDRYSTAFQCPDPIDYFKQRNIGREDRINWVNNPNFLGEDGSGSLAHWSATNCAYYIDNQHYLLPPVAGHLHSVIGDGDSYISQFVVFPAQDQPIYAYFAAQCFITDADWQGPAYGNRGLYLNAYEPDIFDLQSIAIDIQEITYETERDTWIRLEGQIPLTYTDNVNIIEVRLYAPYGKIWWQGVVGVRDQVIGVKDLDQTVFAERMVSHGQDVLYGKSHENIACTPFHTGRIIDRNLHESDHDEIWSRGLKPLTEERDGLDIQFELNPDDPTEREIKLYYPRRGVYRPDLPLELDVNVSDFDHQFDGTEAASHVVALGPNDGPTREEGSAIDNARFDGHAYEKIVRLPEDTKIDQLDQLAQEELSYSGNPQTLELVITDRYWVELLLWGAKIGDNYPVLLNWGYINVDETMRMVRKQYRKDNTLVLSMNWITS